MLSRTTCPRLPCAAFAVRHTVIICLETCSIPIPMVYTQVVRVHYYCTSSESVRRAGVDWLVETFLPTAAEAKQK